MKCLIIVNESPWGSGLALGAWRFARAASEGPLDVVAVFFREDGIYNAVQGGSADSGTPDLEQAWRALAGDDGTELLLCRSSLDRRLAERPVSPWQVSGLTPMFEIMLDCDRVVTF
ncbi:DsrE/DsrF/TusD sulfur relay family protein [Elongatibacter sediminis]|uniref:DsrE family protein n=1 Tax=Elongatibacter sediminis TaxID=3119006 RepID=A0AAW9R9Y8_9GAMM